MNRPCPFPTYIVTGATGAIGRAITATIARCEYSCGRDCRIILACRNGQKASNLIADMAGEAETSHAEVIFMPLDLGNMASVDRFAAELREKAEKEGWIISGLVNNAGTMPGKMILTADGHESASQINYLATKRLTELLIPAVADGGAIVFTTSLTRHFVRLHDDWEERARSHHSRFITYGRSKLMITRFALRLARKLVPRRIRVNCNDPWIVDSPMISLGLPTVDRLSNRLFRPLIHTPMQGASGAVHALFSPLTGHIFCSTDLR